MQTLRKWRFPRAVPICCNPLLAAFGGFACLATPAKATVVLGVNLSQTEGSPDETGFTN
jgi:hypothetical protein